ncbi:restriction endonuclease subunit S [Cyclobacterium marinum]|uniref:HTTM domain-containing protein n=1 Tax=Cyclobacterium marinum (strain ATCC 25205 / DSM 745 / LMG 13164 / NCIMB 1802) TaxID=880070 RepID=G0IZ14_CYCMS|nr:restriction endonuclease subunit S [Cyclobacterium marinum]AEL28159.1 HTTM domain-containing protein [Cyclobacterium marinum DSM 745]
MISSINEKINNWLINTWAPNFFQLGLSRILFCLGYLVYGLPEFKEIANIPLVFFDPPLGLSLFLGLITSYDFWWAFDLLVRIFFVCLLVGFRTKLASIIFSLLLLFGYSYLYSYGKIDHNIFAVIFPLFMAFTNWGGALSIDSLSFNTTELKPKGWPLSFFSFLLGWGYFTAGWPKLMGDWLDPSYSITAGYILRKFHSGQELLYLNELFVQINNLFIYKVLDYSTLIFELGFILTIFWSALFLRSIGIAAMFHLGVLLTLNIAFTTHVLVFLPYIMYFYFSNSSEVSEKYQQIFSKNRNVFITVFLIFSGFILIDYYPLPFQIHSHIVLFIICTLSMLMLLPKPIHLYFIKTKIKSSE